MSLLNRIKVLLIIFLILPVIPIVGCSTISYQSGDVRNLRMVVIYNDDIDLDKALAMIEEASLLTFRETGIVFTVVKTIGLGGESQYGNLDCKDAGLALGQVRSLCFYEGLKDKDYDIAIAFNNDKFLLKHLSWAGSKRFGVIEDDYRRYIVLYHPTVRVIRHEVYHGFLLSKGHTSRLMGSMSVLNPMGSMLNNGDREEILENKWRDFSKRVRLSIKNRRDRLSPLAE